MRDERAQRRVLGGDDRYRLVRLRAGYRIAGIDAHADTGCKCRVFLSFAAKHCFAERLLIVRCRLLHCNDLLALAGRQAALDLRRNALPEFSKRLRGAVVRLEHDAARMIALLELVHTFDACSLEAHDGLVVVANRHYVGLLDALAQQVDYAHLRAVSVLELIDLDVAIGVLKALTQLAAVLDGAHEIENHIVVVVEASLVELGLIARRNLAGNF